MEQEHDRREPARGARSIRETLLPALTLGLAGALVATLVDAAGEILANGYLALGYRRLALASASHLALVWTGRVLVWLAPVGVLVALAGIGAGGGGGGRGRGWRGRLAAWTRGSRGAALAVGLTLLLLAGYRVNRYEFGDFWKSTIPLLGLPVPEGLLTPRVLLGNLLITLAALGAGLSSLGLLALRRPARILGGGGGAVAAACLLLALPAARPILAPHARGLPNVLLITVDTLRADRVGPRGPRESLTPNLDRLATRGGRFAEAYSTAPWTLPAMASIFTGMYPSEHGAYDYNRRFPRSVTTLTEVLRERGYRTGAIVFSAYVQPFYGFYQGFDSFRHFGRRTRRSEISSDRISRLAADWLRGNSDRPFFLFLHFFDPHYNYISHGGPALADYDGPVRSNHDIYELRKMQDRLRPEDLDVLRGLYDEEVRFTDLHIGRVLDELERLGVAENTLIVVSADHGDEFLDHGWLGHTRTLYEGLLRVPLLVVDPRESFERHVVRQPVSIRRIPATILDLLGLEAPPGAFPGASLRPLLEGAPEDPAAPVFASCFFSRKDKRTMKRAVRRGRWKLLYDYDSKGFELYDLERDPGEEHNLVEADPEAAEAMKGLLGPWAKEMDRLRGRRDGEGPMELDRSILEQLRAMGYVQ